MRQRRSYLAQLRTMIERNLAEIEAAEASTASMTPERRRTAPDATHASAPVESPAWLDTLVKE